MNLFKLLTIAALLTVTNLVKAQCESPTFDGYTYDVVQIGNQCWFAENLRTTVLRDGTPITLITDNNGTDTTSVEESRNNPTGLYRAMLPDTLDGLSTSNSHTYYGRGVVMSQFDGNGVCPVGWRVPSHGEWLQLVESNNLAGLAAPVGQQYRIAPQADHDEFVHGYASEDYGPTIPDSYFGLSQFPSSYTWPGTNSTGFNLTPTGFINSSSNTSQFDAGGSNNWDWDLRTEIINNVDNPVFGIDYLKRIDWYVNLKASASDVGNTEGLEPWQIGPRHKAVQLYSAMWTTLNTTGARAGIIKSSSDPGGFAYILGVPLSMFTSDKNPYVPIRCIQFDEEIIPGCTDELACNFDPEANQLDDSCEYPEEGFSCDCEFLCPGDFNGDGARVVEDLLLFLGAYGQPCSDLFPTE